MAVVFVEARPKGKTADSPVAEYVVEDDADHILATFRTQGDAIYWAKKHGHKPHVARVRHLNDKKNLIIGVRCDECRSPYQTGGTVSSTSPLPLNGTPRHSISG